MKKHPTLTTILFILFFSSLVYSQDSPAGYQNQIKEAILNSNNITTIIYNYGSIGKPNTLSNIADLAWDSLGYMFEFGPIGAAEVVNDSGDTLHITDDSFVLTTQGNYNVDGTQKWGWLPDSGYADPNQNEIATKNNPSSWPSSWTNWPEFDGDSLIHPLNEAYYVMDDYSNEKFPYYPFPSDSSKRGLGLKAEVKVFQFGGSLKDALIIKYKLTNESPKAISKMYFGFHGDPHIGGSSDYADDRAHVYFNKNNADPNSAANNTIYMWDDDGVGAFGKPTGYLGFRFLETPGDIGLSSMHIAPYTNSLPNVPKNSELMWQWLNGSIDSSSVLYSQPGDNIINFGTGPFSLNAGESKYLTLAIFLAHDFKGMLNNSVYLYWNHFWPNISSDTSTSGGSSDYEISSITPNSGEVNGLANINWNYSGTDNNAKALIEYSSDFGKNWNILASDLDASANTYSWNTEKNKDGVNYLLRIIAYNPDDKRQNYFSVGSNRFTINNSVNAQPELQLLSLLKDSIITNKFVNISWLMEDADNSELNIKIGYALSRNGAFTNIYDNTASTGTKEFNWDISELPNANSYFLQIIASDGNSDTTQITGPFALNYLLKDEASTNLLHIKGSATPDFNIQIIDSSLLKSDTYEITFNAEDQSAKTFSIVNVSNNQEIISDYPLKKNLSTPTFDGLKLIINDCENGIDLDKTTFNNPAINHTVSFIYPAELGNPKIALPSDWEIIWNNLDTTITGEWLEPGDTTINNLGKPIVTPFRIYDITNNQFVPASYLIFENKFSTRNQIWNWPEAIILRPTNAADATTAYEIKLDFTQNPLPGAGDTLYIITNKTITSKDVFRFAIGNNEVVVSAKEKNIPTKYQLSQNYPNPFNPTTTINYQIEKAGYVNLKVYNILGQEIKTLVNDVKAAGKYNVLFNASSLASGVYIYRLTINNFVSVKKMELIK